MVPWRAFAWAWWTIEVSTRWLSPSATSRTCGNAVTASVRGILRRGSSSVTIDSSRHCGGPVAEVDGNRTRQTEMLGLDGFEDRSEERRVGKGCRCGGAREIARQRTKEW